MTDVMRAILWVPVGAVLILDPLIVSFTSGFSSGVVATFLLGVLYLWCGLYRGGIRARTKRLIGWVRILVLVGTALSLLLFASIALLGRADTVSHREDAVIVLGTALKGDEVTPSLRSRLDVAVEYSTANPDAVVVVTGGQGPGETIAEALAMERYLVAHGVAEGRIVREDRSTSTYENFVRAKVLLDARLDAGYTTAFITSEYHVFRAGEIAQGAGIGSTHAHADTPWYQVPVDYVRELLAITKLVVTGR
ncbi:YdcF family protein [Promicromonospora xylanilytica]